MDIKDFKVGQTVWIMLTGNATRGKHGDELIEEWVINKIGRKYITASKKTGYSKEVVFEDNKCIGYNGRFVEKTNYCVDYIMYATEQEVRDEMEMNRIYREIQLFFDRFNKNKLTLEQLRSIKKIIDEESE